MIWLDIKKLENDICINELTDKDGFYFFLYLLYWKSKYLKVD